MLVLPSRSRPARHDLDDFVEEDTGTRARARGIDQHAPPLHGRCARARAGAFQRAVSFIERAGVSFINGFIERARASRSRR